MIIRPQPFFSLGSSNSSVCFKCLHRIVPPPPIVATTCRRFTTATSSGKRDAAASPRDILFREEYFLANGFLKGKAPVLKRRVSLDTSPTATVNTRTQAQKQQHQEHTGQLSPIVPPIDPAESPNLLQELPHRRRQRVRQESRNLTPNFTDPVNLTIDPVIPPDASSRLSTLSSSLPTRSLRRLLTTYLSLSKPRLSFLIVLTTTSAYSLYPVPALLLPSTTIAPSLSTLTLLFLTTGTALICASANTLNMLLEPAHDAKMSRTRNRPLVRKLISPRGALGFAIATGLTGLGALYYGVNPTVAFLGGFNIFLYAGIYTPLKRISVLNTWVGALVGGIPPLMGWTAAAGQSATGSGGWQELLLGDGSAGGWLLAGLLFAWQHPHFSALSWTIRDEYKNAGYRMLAWVNPRMNARVALRYSLMFFPICAGLWWVDVTDQGFLLTSSLINGWLVREAWRFYRRQGAGGSARGLFWASVWHLPVLMVLAMAHKKGLWERVWNSIMGADDIWEDGEDELEEVEESGAGEMIGAVPGTR